jgi:predicted permease
MLQQVLTVVTPVFLIAGVGYLWFRRGLPFDNFTVSSLVMFIGSPCLIYSSLTRNAPALQDLGVMAAAAAFAIAVGAVLAYPLLRLFGWHPATYLPSLIHPNTGNMGLPVVLLAFGEAGLALGMTFFFVNSISQFTVGLAVSSGRFQPWALLKQPVIWAVALVLLTLTTGWSMPGWFNATTELLGGLTVPAMLLMLGTSLARLNVTALRETLTVALLRLLLGLILAITAIWIFELDGMLAGVVLLQCTMPAAVFNYVFAERFDREPDKVAAVILLSTLLSVASLPLLVGVALSL